MVEGITPKPLYFTKALPFQAGTYVLLTRLVKEVTLTIGRLGPIVFKPGFYAYVGSAFGPGGLAARVGRHLSSAPKQRWHLDYLKPHVRPLQIWINTHPIVLEHTWADAFLAKPRLCFAIERFGCSDCSCRSHLFCFRRRPSPSVLPDDCAVIKIDRIVEGRITDGKEKSSMFKAREWRGLRRSYHRQPSAFAGAIKTTR